jgi:hypothetical protein
LVAVFDQGLTLLYERGRFPGSLAEFAEYWLHFSDADRPIYARYLDERRLEQACRRLARLDVGAKRLLFHDGVPLTMDLLLGRDESALEGKTRISVIYLNTLSSQEDKEFFVATLARKLYFWMLSNPSNVPQLLFYIDEVAPFIPPVRNPACKRTLAMLFKQARKYGVCCLMATQNPADVDYKAMAQFGTWALGRMTTAQDLKKVRPTIKSLQPDQVDLLMEHLPAQQPGQLLLLSPDLARRAVPIRTRRLYTRHETMDEQAVEELADRRWRSRFLLRDMRGHSQSSLAPQIEHNGPPEHQSEVGGVARTHRKPAADRGDALPSAFLDERAVPDPQQIQQAKVLSRASSMSVSEFAVRAKIPEAVARRALKKLVDIKLAREFRAGRATRYWAVETGLRPDLGLIEPVPAFAPVIQADQAARIGNTLRRRLIQRLVGPPEEVVECNLVYRPLVRIRYQQRVGRALWKRAFGHSELENLIRHTYLNPSTLQIIAYDPVFGLRAHEQARGIPKEHVSELEDLSPLEQKRPGEITLDDQDWQQHKSDAEIQERFTVVFAGEIDTQELVLFPIWELHKRRIGAEGRRLAYIDALGGKRVDGVI